MNSDEDTRDTRYIPLRADDLLLPANTILDDGPLLTEEDISNDLNLLNEILFDGKKSRSTISLPNQVNSDPIEVQVKPAKSNVNNVVASSWQTSLKVFVGTWNMKGKGPPVEPLDDFIHYSKGYDIYAIGVQECERGIGASVVYSSKGKWEEKLLQTLHVEEGEYIMLESNTLGALHLSVFLKKELEPSYNEVVQTDVVPTGVGNMLNNKGGIGIGFVYGDTSFLFVTSHLAAHDRNVAARNADFHRINQTLPLINHKIAEGKGTNVADRFDRVFWFGDLNYRINGTRKMIEELIKSEMTEVLVANDQLSIAKRSGEAWKGFLEGALMFKPTYKYDEGTDQYDTSAKARVPSWTDRILFKANQYINLLEYNSAENVKCSDHRPVYAIFEVNYSLKDSATSHEAQSKVCTIL